ncbi:MAG: hypothetical protein HQK52_20215 [Oligoflexia bacterium]|nr:hypothetical protein [Oligoflexia bacterium]
MKRGSIVATALLLMSSMSASALTSTENYYCNINTLPEKSAVATSKLHEFAKPFIFEKDGVKSKFKEVELFMWNQNQKLNLKIKDATRKLEINTHYPAATPEIVLKWNEFKLQCLTQTKWEELADEGEKLLFPVPLTDDSNLIHYKTRMSILLLADIAVKYVEGDTERDKMKEVFFQRGQIVAKTDNNSDWCLFQLQRKFDQDLVIEQATEIPVLSVSTYNNSNNFFVINYNFIDLNKATKGFETSEWAAFMLKCKISTMRTLTYKLFKEITGNRFVLNIQPLK